MHAKERSMPIHVYGQQQFEASQRPIDDDFPRQVTPRPSKTERHLSNILCTALDAAPNYYYYDPTRAKRTL